MNWTKAKKEELSRLWATEMRAGEIAAHFGVTISSITGQALRMGLPKRHDWGISKPKYEKDSYGLVPDKTRVTLPRIKFLEPCTTPGCTCTDPIGPPAGRRRIRKDPRTVVPGNRSRNERNP